MKAYSRLTLTMGCVALVLIITQTASAQRRGGFGDVSSARLASLEKVQTELKLSGEQKSKIAEINEKVRNQQRELLQDATRDNINEIRPKLAKLSEDATKQVNALLEKSQQKRLRQITLQVNGAASLSDPSVAKELKITDEQKRKLQDVRRANTQAIREAFQSLGDASREERIEKLAKMRAEGDKKLLAALTEDQREAFGKMKGAKIEIDLSQLRRRRNN